MDKELYIKVTENGPYIVYGLRQIGQKVIQNKIGFVEGERFEVITESACLCRCGRSKSAPFCDNSHIESDFNGTETAGFCSMQENSMIFSGKNLKLYDNEKLCAMAKFCDNKGSIWNLIVTGNKEDDEEAVRQANLCPSGRLMVYDNDGNSLENDLSEMVSVLEDEGLKLSGPIFVSGGIRVESVSGKSYEIRNRQTLCRCGGSKNKPFCDCTHVHIKFKADYADKSI